MGTPFMAFMGPTNLFGYDRKKHASEQSGLVPKTFKDAMEVRAEVFVKEQLIPLEHEFDADDYRACHWVAYASVNTVTERETQDSDGNVVKRKQSITESLPIGTIRLVPFPHPPHPTSGSAYSAGASKVDIPLQSPQSLSYIVDRATTFHDGKEPYIKLGRVAVLEEFRKSGIANLLVSQALSWAQENPTYFNPSVANLGLAKIDGSDPGIIPVWNGLICVHAQQEVAEVWEKWGFVRDEEMGTWLEEGIEHVGMFRRLDIAKSRA